MRQVGTIMILLLMVLNTDSLREKMRYNMLTVGVVNSIMIGMMIILRITTLNMNLLNGEY